MSFRHVPPLALLLGVLLLANPLYAFPAGTSPNYYYGLETLDASDETDVAVALDRTGSVFQCPHGPRACALEREIAENGSLTVDGDLISERSRYRDGYDVLWIDGGYVEPVTEVDGDTATLTHAPISQRDALERVALESSEVSADARRAVERGSIWTDGSVPELASRSIVAHDGEYYRVASARYSADGITRTEVWLVRGIGFALGLVLFAFGYRESMG